MPEALLGERPSVEPPAAPDGQVRASAGAAVTGGPGHVPSRWEHFRLVRDFVAYEALAGLRLQISVRAFRRWRLTAAAAGLVVLLALASAIFGVVRDWLGQTGRSPQDVLVVVLLGTSYLGAGYATAELTTRRRYRVSNSPNADFYRGLDVSPLAVFAAVCVIPSALYFAGLSVVHVALAVALLPLPGLRLVDVAGSLWALASILVLTVGLQARAASRPSDPRGARWRTALSLPALVFGLVLVTTRYGVIPAVESLASGLPRTDAGRVLDWSGPIGAVAVAVGGCSLIAGLRRMRTHTFALGVLPGPGASPRHETAPRPRSGSLPVVLLREWNSSWASTLAWRTVVLLLVCLAAAAAVAVAAPSVLPVRTDNALVARLADFATFGLVLGVAETTLAQVGVVALGPQLRTAWELGTSRLRLAAAVLGCFTLPAVVTALVVCALSAVVLDDVTVTPVLVGVGAMAGALLAESAVTPVRNEDGTPVPDVLTSFVGVVAAAPVLLLVSPGRGLTDALALVYVLALTGGALACVMRRLTVHP